MSRDQGGKERPTPLESLEAVVGNIEAENIATTAETMAGPIYIPPKATTEADRIRRLELALKKEQEARQAEKEAHDQEFMQLKESLKIAEARVKELEADQLSGQYPLDLATNKPDADQVPEADQKQDQSSMSGFDEQEHAIDLTTDEKHA